MSELAQSQIFESFTTALARAASFEEPYRHWFIERPLPDDIIEDLQVMQFQAPDLGGVSGKRELHNDQRHYVDQDNIARLPAFAALATAFQAPEMAAAIEDFFGVDLNGTFLRIEYAQDVTGFWLEPHTDLGVKRLTVLVYLSDGDGHGNLGTDVYTGDKKWMKRSPFRPNFAMAFVPGDHTYHGFEARDISGVRKSLILNYVTNDWRDREQLAFPDQTVSEER
jgi:hypothetical protein